MEKTPSPELGSRLGRGDLGLWLWMGVPLWLLAAGAPGAVLGEGTRFPLVAWFAWMVGAWPKRSEDRGGIASSVWWWSALAPWILAGWHLDRVRGEEGGLMLLILALGGLALAVLCGAPLARHQRGWQCAWFALLWWVPLFAGFLQAASPDGVAFLALLVNSGPSGVAWTALDWAEPWAPPAWQALGTLAAWGLGIHFGFRRRA